MHEEQGIQLLLVDDEAGFLASTTVALRRRGIAVTAVQCGGIALELLENKKFDAAVIDLKMPGMTGDVLLGEIKKQWPDIPVIILTGYGTPEQAGKFSLEGVFHYLLKPCNIDSLVGVIRQSVNADWRRWLRRLRNC